MTFPINIHLFGFEISTHLVTEIAAFFLGYRFYAYLKKKNPTTLSTEKGLVILISAALGALLFSRLIAALENLDDWKNAPNFWLYLYGSKTVVGGFLGGWLFVEVAKKLLKITKSTGDLMAFPIIFALIIGRIGCFSQGIHEQTYGYPTSWITGMDLGDGIIRHPLALYEIVYLLLIAVFLYIIQRKQKLEDGFQFKLMMFIYFAYRFFAEWAKPHNPLLIGLTSIQLGILVCYLSYSKTIFKLIIHPKNTLYGART